MARTTTLCTPAEPVKVQVVTVPARSSQLGATTLSTSTSNCLLVFNRQLDGTVQVTTPVSLPEGTAVTPVGRSGGATRVVVTSAVCGAWSAGSPRARTARVTN
jgi:hypothetical protein